MKLDEVLDVINSNEKVIVRFWATWCAPCKMMEPIVKRVVEGTDIKLVSVNVDEQIDVAEYFDVMSIPHFKAFKDGAEVADLIGYRPEKIFKEQFVSKLE